MRSLFFVSNARRVLGSKVVSRCASARARYRKALAEFVQLEERKRTAAAEIEKGKKIVANQEADIAKLKKRTLLIEEIISAEKVLSKLCHLCSINRRTLQLLLQNLIHNPRVGLAAGGFHDLAYGESI